MVLQVAVGVGLEAAAVLLDGLGHRSGMEASTKAAKCRLLGSSSKRALTPGQPRARPPPAEGAVRLAADQPGQGVPVPASSPARRSRVRRSSSCRRWSRSPSSVPTVSMLGLRPRSWSACLFRRRVRWGRRCPRRWRNGPGGAGRVGGAGRRPVPGPAAAVARPGRGAGGSYGEGHDLGELLERVTVLLAERYAERAEELKLLDLERSIRPNWFQDPR